jgi:uncharacterized protein (TIGR02271 family)
MSAQQEIVPGMPVLDLRGERAVVVGLEGAGNQETVLLELTGQSRLIVERSLLRSDGEALLFQGEFEPLLRTLQAATAKPEGDDEMVMRAVEEALHVGKRRVETGRGVRVSKQVHEREEVVDLPLAADDFVIERVPRDELLAEGELPVQREEDGTLILPVLEEVLVVQKRLRLREEIHIRRRRQEVHAPQRVVLRREELEVQRFDRNRE